MDPASLIPLLEGTLNPLDATRRAAEEALRQAASTPGYIAGLLTVVTTAGVPDHITLSAALAFKNAIARGWREVSKEFPSLYSQEEKEPIRAGLIEVIMHMVHRPHLLALASPVSYIAKEDYPDRWEPLVPMLLKNLSSGDSRRIYNTVVVIRVLCKGHERISPTGRGPFNMFLTGVMPALAELFKAAIESNSIEAAELMVLIVKIYFSATCIDICESMATEASISTWFQLINQALSKKLPEASEGLEPAGQPTDIDERAKWPWWKLKKWCSWIASRFFSRYGIARFTQDHLVPLARYFASTIAPTLMSSLMNLLALRSTGGYCAPKVELHALSFLQPAIELTVVYKLIKPHVEFVVWQICLPVCSFNAEDHELWTSDPEDYVRREMDDMTVMTDASAGSRHAAMIFVQNLLRLRFDDWFPMLWKGFNERCDAYLASGAAAGNAPQKDGLLSLLEASLLSLGKTPEHRAQVQAFLDRHLLPELTGPHPYLRARAVRIYCKFPKRSMTTPDSCMKALEGIFAALEDPETPVRFTAGSHFRMLLHDKDVCSLIQPKLMPLINSLFALLGHIGVDDIVSTLEDIIRTFSQDLATIGPPLLQKLVELFQRYATEAQAAADADQDIDESPLQFAASNCLDCINTILSNAYLSPDSWPEITELLYPMLMVLMRPDGEWLAYFEQSLSCLSYLAIRAPLTPKVWEIFHNCLEMFEGHAFDYIAELLLPMDAFMRRGIEMFLTVRPDGGSFMQTTWKILRKTESSDELDAIMGTKLMWSLFHYARGRVDPFIKDHVNHFLTRIPVAVRSEYRVAVIMSILVAFMYNPILAHDALASTPGAVGGFFDYLIANIDEIKTDDDLQVLAMGLSCVLRIPAASMSPDLTSRLPTLFSHHLRKLEFLVEGPSNAPDAEDSDDDEEELEEDEVAVADPGEDADAFDPRDILQHEALMSADFEPVNNVDMYLMSSAYGGPTNYINAVVHLYDTAAGLDPAAFASLKGALAPDAAPLLDKLLTEGKEMKENGTSGDLNEPPPEIEYGDESDEDDDDV